MITAANAQDTNGEKRMNRRFDPQEMVQRRTQQMAEKYQLTAEQAEKVKALNEKYMELARRYRDQRPERPEGERGEMLYMFDGHNLFVNEDATYGKSWGLKLFLDN